MQLLFLHKPEMHIRGVGEFLAHQCAEAAGNDGWHIVSPLCQQNGWRHERVNLCCCCSCASQSMCTPVHLFLRFVRGAPDPVRLRLPLRCLQGEMGAFPITSTCVPAMSTILEHISVLDIDLEVLPPFAYVGSVLIARRGSVVSPSHERGHC